MKNKLFFTIFIVLVPLMLKKGITANCNSLISSAITYLQQTQPGQKRLIYFQMGSFKAPAKFIAYSVGQFKLSYTLIRRFQQKYLLAKDVKTTFSDRSWCTTTEPNSFCQYQNFDFRKADVSQLSLYPNSTAKIVLTTWGNAVFTYPLQCQDDFIYGTLRQSNGNSLIALSLRRDSYIIPK